MATGPRRITALIGFVLLAALAVGDGGSSPTVGGTGIVRVVTSKAEGMARSYDGSGVSTVTNPFSGADFETLQRNEVNSDIATNGSRGGDSRASQSTTIKRPTDVAKITSDGVAFGRYFDNAPGDEDIPSGEGTTRLEVKVVVVGDTRSFKLTGTLTASASGSLTGCASVRVTAPDGTVHEASAPASCGASATTEIDQEGTLEPGTHTFVIEARATAVNASGTGGSAEAKFTGVKLAFCDNDFTDGPDTITGTSGNDLLCGGDGDDTINGLGGVDVILGGDGGDSVNGGGGDDTIEGQEGADSLKGNEGDDVIDGGEGNDALSGLAGSDVLIGGEGGDTLLGGSGNEVRTGSPGIDGGPGRDIIRGGAGDDFAVGGPERDQIFGEGGADKLRGDGGPDVIEGGARTDVLNGGAQNDTLRARDGTRDTVDGGPNVDNARVDATDQVVRVENLT